MTPFAFKRNVNNYKDAKLSHKCRELTVIHKELLYLIL